MTSEIINELLSARTYLGSLAIRSDELDRKSLRHITGTIKKAIGLLKSQPDIVQCKDCKYFEIKEWWQDEILMADDCPTCHKWGGGCKTVENGYCFMWKRRNDDDRR